MLGFPHESVSMSKDLRETFKESLNLFFLPAMTAPSMSQFSVKQLLRDALTMLPDYMI